jgi:hypothetical protein
VRFKNLIYEGIRKVLKIEHISDNGSKTNTQEVSSGYGQQYFRQKICRMTIYGRSENFINMIWKKIINGENVYDIYTFDLKSFEYVPYDIIFAYSQIVN